MRKFVFGIIVGIFLPICTQGNAAVLSIGGTVSEGLPAELVGSEWNITIDLNLGSIDTNSHPSVGSFPGADSVISFSFSLGSETIFTPLATFEVTLADFGRSVFSVSGNDFTNTITIAGLPFRIFQIMLSAPAGTITDTSDLGQSLRELFGNSGLSGDSASSFMSLATPGLNTSLDLDVESFTFSEVSAVPIPSTFLFSLAAIVALGLVAARRRRSHFQ